MWSGRFRSLLITPMPRGIRACSDRYPRLLRSKNAVRGGKWFGVPCLVADAVYRGGEGTGTQRWSTGRATRTATPGASAG